MKRLLLLCFAAASALAQTTPQVLLTWIAPTTYTDGTIIAPAVISYNVYQYNGGVWTKIGTSAVTTYTVTPVTPGTSYTFHVTAVVGAAESAASQSATITPAVVLKTANPPTGLTAK